VSAALGAGRDWSPGRPFDLPTSLGSLRRGRGDPTHQVTGGVVWRTARTPAGPATLSLTPLGDRVRAQAWGPGSGWLLEVVPDLLGRRDDPSAFRPTHPLIAGLHRGAAGLFLPRASLVLEMLVPAVLEQKVTGLEARRSWRELVLRFGDPAPGPAPPGMSVAPDAQGWASIPSWDWHLAGVEARRARTIAAACAIAPRLEATLGDPLVSAPDSSPAPGAPAAAVLRTIPGVGAWTAAEVTARAHGDADAVSVGDYHLPGLVGWAFLRRRVDDDGMLELLEPFRPHRYRVIRLLETSGIHQPRFGPRMPVRSMRGI
jgi:3-methyladenine DNA glycosylase/8-oxoguanine DNA glycosylase